MLKKEPIEVQPGIHYFMGGIKVDEHHNSSVNYLYAAGECCCQYHGANRIGGNSILGAIFGGVTAGNTFIEDIKSKLDIKNIIINNIENSISESDISEIKNDINLKKEYDDIFKKRNFLSKK
ncbi:FAD-binding protein [Methanobrevibacter arboriphilus]|uniref:FAD-binding protein n=1 Tax=Methanobrevibacter arboriphilus TaxID=39441 RepID=UPI002981390D|nr:FAD-binding protein [Methanobrevibacter arboriphilus]